MQHPNYKYLADADPKNAFDVEKYLSARLRLHAEDAYEVYEVDDAEMDAEASADTAPV